MRFIVSRLKYFWDTIRNTIDKGCRMNVGSQTNLIRVKAIAMLHCVNDFIRSYYLKQNTILTSKITFLSYLYFRKVSYLEIKFNRIILI